MTLQADDFWSYYQWLMRPDAFLESALLKGLVLAVLAVVLGIAVGYVVSASRYGPVEGFYAMARAIRDLIRFDLPGTSLQRIGALARLAFKEAIRRARTQSSNTTGRLTRSGDTAAGTRTVSRKWRTAIS